MTRTSTDAVEALRRRGSVYARLGVRPIINANGTQTTLGGSIMEPEAAEAMAAASGAMVVLQDLNEAAGRRIAEITGAAAGLVTSGAAAAMTLQAAAVVAGDDPDKMARLPHSPDARNRIVLKRSHNSEFVQAWRQGGARITWVGDDRGAEESEVEAAIDHDTVALGFIASRWHDDSFEGLRDFASIARRRGLPLLVDAAAMLPPAENLQRFVALGADMVCYSGGKAIRGPQSSGILCGRADLIAAAAANASPNHAVGRPMKVAREEIVGLITALDLYVRRDHDADAARWRSECQSICDAASLVAGVRAAVEQHDWLRPVPEASIAFTPARRGRGAGEIAEALAAGDPPIHIEASRREGEDIFVNPHGFRTGEAELVAERLSAALRPR